MARNRKYKSAAIRFGPALKAFLSCLLIGGAGVGYVWQKDQISRLETQIRQRENHLKMLRDQNAKQQQALNNMHLPRYLELRIKEANLGLVPPEPSQVWYLPEPPKHLPPAPAEPELASGGPAGVR